MPNCAATDELPCSQKPCRQRAKRRYHAIWILLAASSTTTRARGKPRNVNSGEFDYHSFEPAKKYFSSRSASEVTRMCDAGDHASNDDLAQCSHLKFERVNHELDRKLQLARAALEHSDKSLKAEGEPLASPYFVKSQSAWVQYRDNECYTETYMMGEAAERYIFFWKCMINITQKRVKEVQELLKN